MNNINNGDGSRVECRWKPLREGEMSPYKMLVALFIREVYVFGGDKRGGDDRVISPRTLMLIYNLINSYDVDTFVQFKGILERPEYCVRTEVLKKFFRLTANLESNNAYVLYEVANSLVTMEASQMIVLKKKITKSSPFGKFLTGMYLNIKKLSYPQINYMYKQLLEYLHTVESVPTTPSHGKKEKSQRCLKGLDIFQKLEEKKQCGQLDLELFSNYVMEYGKLVKTVTHIEEEAFKIEKQKKKDRIAVAKEKAKGLRDLWTKPQEDAKSFKSAISSISTPTDISRSVHDSSSNGKSSPSYVNKADGSMKRVTRSSSSPGKSRGMSTKRRSTSLRRIYFSSPRRGTEPEIIESSPTSSPLEHWQSEKPAPKSPIKSCSEELAEQRVSEPLLKDLATFNIMKRWSRRQIERALKSLISRLYCANSAVPSPSEITLFVTLALKSPSAQVLYSHLHYLEYLNCLRIKDIARCTDSLRAAFDVRMKPNASEFNKGTTYAAYNFALFYHNLGYTKDALSCLDEAFKAGHAAGDATCLHHCHNLWSSFHDRVYSDAIVTVRKEVDNNMAYLHSLNVIVNAFEMQLRCVAPDELLHSLWHYNADCDLEEMEGLLLSALSYFFALFGWHEMTCFPAQMILFSSNWKWSSRFYVSALCSLSQCLLYHGDVKTATEIMDYGEEIFGFDASPAGESFTLQHAIFNALKFYLACEPIPEDLIGLIFTFDKREAIYWEGYNGLFNDSGTAGITMLRWLVSVLDSKDEKPSMKNNDLKLRCLMALAELHCYNKNHAGALYYLTIVVEMGLSLNSDVYATWGLIGVAAVQAELGLLQTSFLTMEQKLRTAIRSLSPWLKAKINVIQVKLLMKGEEKVGRSQRTEILEKLEWTEQMYAQWGNNYRIKEVLHLKAELFDRATDLPQGGSFLRKKLSAIKTKLNWSPDTCII